MFTAAARVLSGPLCELKWTHIKCQENTNEIETTEDLDSFTEYFMGFYKKQKRKRNHSPLTEEKRLQQRRLIIKS